MAVVQGLLWFMLGHGATNGLAWGGAAFGGFVMLHVLFVVVDGWRDRREEGPAGPGPSSLGQVTSQANGHDIWVAVHAALAAQGFSRAWRLDSNTVEASIVQMLGGRRFLTVRVEGAGPHGAVVTAWGHPDTSLNGALFDGGLCRRATNRVLAAIPGGTPVC